MVFLLDPGDPGDPGISGSLVVFCSEVSPGFPGSPPCCRRSVGPPGPPSPWRVSRRPLSLKTYTLYIGY